MIILFIWLKCYNGEMYEKAFSKMQSKLTFLLSPTIVGDLKLSLVDFNQCSLSLTLQILLTQQRCSLNCGKKQVLRGAIGELAAGRTDGQSVLLA